MPGANPDRDTDYSKAHRGFPRHRGANSAVTLHQVQGSFLPRAVPFAIPYLPVTRCYVFSVTNCTIDRSQWPRDRRRRFAGARLPRLWFRISAGAWMSVCCEYCVLSGRVLCLGLISRLEESYRLWCVGECDLETSCMRRPWPTVGFCTK